MGSPKQRPLMLKDYLRDDQGFDSRDGFPLMTTDERTVRGLLDLELGGGRLTRSRSKGMTFTRISAFFNAVRSLAVANSPPKGHMQGILQRSFSRKLLPKTLWRRCSRREERGHFEDIKNRFSAGKVLIKDVIRLESFVDENRGGRSVLLPPHPSSPVGSCCNSCSCSTSGWSEMESSSGCDSLPSLSSPVPDFLTKRNTSPDKNIRPNNHISTSPKKDEIEEQDAEDRVACRDYEEKEQLSPVSVMDFPYEEEEEEVASEMAEASPSFQQSLASIERTKMELLKKIRRFESIALLVDPVDLDDAFSEGSDEHVDGGDELESIECDEVRIRAKELADDVTLWVSADSVERSSQELLLEFSSEGLRDSITDDPTVQERLLRAPREWTDEMVPKDVASREALMREMDTNGRWICGNEVDEGVGADLEGEVLGSLLLELVEELFLD